MSVHVCIHVRVFVHEHCSLVACIKDLYIYNYTCTCISYVHVHCTCSVDGENTCIYMHGVVDRTPLLAVVMLV